MPRTVLQIDAAAVCFVSVACLAIAHAYENAIRLEVADSRRSLLRWGIAALISVLLFLAHWKLLVRESRRPG